MSDHPDFVMPTLGPISKESRLEWRSTLENNGDVATMQANNLTNEKAKFFPRGCRGFIDTVEVYCDNAGAAARTLTVDIMPMPDVGPVITASLNLAGGSPAAWQVFTIRRMWNYDSMFLSFASDNNAWGRIGYDKGQSYDAYYLSAILVWMVEDRRYWIRVNFKGETPGDIPISGMVNTIPIPSLSSAVAHLAVAVPANVFTLVHQSDGYGYSDLVVFKVRAAAGSHNTTLSIACDGVGAFSFTFADLSGLGFVANSPVISLLLYAANGICVVSLSKRFEFRRSLAVYAYNAANPVTVDAWVFPILGR